MTLVVGWLDNGWTAGEFTESVSRLAAYEVAKQRLTTTIRVQSGPLLSEGRNLLVERFLTTNADWLLMVDSDMTFPHDAAERLLAVADPHTRRVVGGLCFGVNKELGQFPTIYQRIQGLPVAILDIPDGLVTEVDGTGAAFLLQHRTVFEDYPRDDPHHPWFHRRTVPPSGDHPGGVLGEDLSWCWHLRDQGVPVYVAPHVEVGHVKQTVVNRDTYQRPPRRTFDGEASDGP